VDVFEEKVWIPAGDDLLEGELVYDPWRDRCEAVLLLSPHPNFAGTMENNVIRELVRTFAKAGYGVLRFNYPGVGASTINLPAGISSFDYWEAVEQEQNFTAALLPSLAAFDFLCRSLGTAMTAAHLIGYSFGGIIALLLSKQRQRIESVTAISMPWIDRYDYAFLSDTLGKKYFFTGDRDFACDPEARARIWPAIPDPKIFIPVDDDHFFRKNESRLAAMVLQQLSVANKPRTAPSGNPKR